MVKIAVIFYSGYGHTEKLADAVLSGIESVHETTPHLIAIDDDGEISDENWQLLDQADAIIFGSPTYMGSVAWQFKKMADASSKRWFNQDWKDKIAAGFTNSASMSGDKLSTINYMFTLAMQHSMIWVGTGIMPSSSTKAQRNDLNYLGAFSGLLAQSPSDAPPDIAPPKGDLETAKLFGERVAEVCKRWNHVHNS